MKSKTKIAFIEADDLKELAENTNKELEALELNVNNKIKVVNLIQKYNGGYITIITYEECKEILTEGVE